MSYTNNLYLQHLYLERDYIRTMDNILLNLDTINSRYHHNTFLESNNRNRSNRYERWGRRNRNRFDNTSWYNRQTRNWISPSPPPPPPPLNFIVPPPPPPPVQPPPAQQSPISRTTDHTLPRRRNIFRPYIFSSNNATNTDTPLTNFINNTLNTPFRRDYPTYNEVLNSTTTLFYSDLSGNTTCTRCAISRDDFLPNDLILKIDHCNHIFKKESLLSWFENSSKCPICRHDIRTNNTTSNTNNTSNTINTSNTNNYTNTNNDNISTNTLNSTDVNWGTITGNNIWNGRNLFTNTFDISNNYLNSFDNLNSFDISNNDINNFITENLTSVLDNLGNAVIDNIGSVVEEVLSHSMTDISNNHINATFGYELHFPPPT
jgi:hypothetical protein